MKLSDLLKEYGMFANDIRKRLQDKQILVNGESKEGDYDLGNIAKIFDMGFFLEVLYKSPNYNKYKFQIEIFGLDSLMGGESNVKNELTDFLTNYKMIQISKESIIFVETSTTDQTDEIIFYKDGTGKSKIKIDTSSNEVDIQEVIDKLKSDKANVEKQLSNPGFIKNAPPFKLDAAKKKLDNLNRKLQELGVSENIVTRFKDF